MRELSARDYELVAIGAAIASNCIPCIEYHIPEARKSGLTDAQILEAVLVAEKLKLVPARKVLDSAKHLLNTEPYERNNSGCGCDKAEDQSADSCCT